MSSKLAAGGPPKCFVIREISVEPHLRSGSPKVVDLNMFIEPAEQFNYSDVTVVWPRMQASP